MCNLYRMTKSTAEVANLFGAAIGDVGNAGRGEVFPGYPGLVVANGELRSMVWGFPLGLKGKTGQALKPVNNARADKLDGFIWRYSFQQRRCRIPVSAFAEAEGEEGAKTRAWFSFPDAEPFAIAGLWRDTPEWGLCYTMVMTEACIPVADVHDRMPVILKPADWSGWLDGPPDAAGLLCRPYPEQVICDRTTMHGCGGLLPSGNFGWKAGTRVGSAILTKHRRLLSEHSRGEHCWRTGSGLPSFRASTR